MSQTELKCSHLQAELADGRTRVTSPTGSGPMQRGLPSFSFHNVYTYYSDLYFGNLWSVKAIYKSHFQFATIFNSILGWTFYTCEFCLMTISGLYASLYRVFYDCSSIKEYFNSVSFCGSTKDSPVTVVYPILQSIKKYIILSLTSAKVQSSLKKSFFKNLLWWFVVF